MKLILKIMREAGQVETNKVEQLHHNIAQVLVNMIPEDWEKVFLYSEVREGFSQVYFYYYPRESLKPIYSLDIPDIFEIDTRKHKQTKQELYGCFEDLWNEFKVQEQEPWTNLTYILERTGKMKLNYKYDDVSKLDPVDKQEKWEKENLEF